MDSTSRPESRELADYVALLKRRWWVVAASAALGIAVASMLIVILPKTYSSFAVVNVTPTGVERSGQAGRNRDINLQTESQRVRSVEVSTRAAQIMGDSAAPTPPGSSVTVNVPNDSTVLYITANAPTATGARDRAHAFAQAYLDDRRDSAGNVLKNQIGALTRQIDSLRKELDSSADKITRQLIIGQMQTLNTKLTDARNTAANVTPGEIITDAELPSSPSDPSMYTYLPSGLVAGLLLGVVGAVLFDRTDKRVRSAEDVERVLDLPVLLDVPPKRGADALGLLPARSRTGQNFHELCHSLAATLGHGNHVILVTGAAPGRGASVVATNIAASLARTGSQVLLVCADLNSSMSSGLLGIPQGPGLAEVLLARAEIREVVRKNASLPALRVISSGMDGELAAEMLQREQMSRVISQLRNKSRYIVLEAPSTALSADAQALADLADAALVVIETPRTRYVQIRDGVRQIHRMGAAVLGAVVLPRQDEKALLPASTRGGKKPASRRGEAAPRRGKAPSRSAAELMAQRSGDDSAGSGRGESRSEGYSETYPDSYSESYSEEYADGYGGDNPGSRPGGSHGDEPETAALPTWTGSGQGDNAYPPSSPPSSAESPSSDILRWS